jgi:hypothetical protein
MEIAQIVLEYIKVLVYPFIILVVFLSFRKEIRLILGRLKEGKQYEIEIGGQKLKVNLLEEGLDDVLQKAKQLESSDKSELQEAGEGIRLKVETLSTASMLTPLEVRFLTKFYADDRLSMAKISDKYEGIPDAMISKGLLMLEHQTGNLYLTATGKNILDWLIKSNAPEHEQSRPEM